MARRLMTPEEQQIAEQIEVFLRTNGEVNQKNNDKIRFSVLPDGRVDVDYTAIGDQFNTILDKLNAYLKKNMNGKKRVGTVTHWISMTSLLQKIVPHQKGVPEDAGRYFEWCFYDVLYQRIKAIEPSAKRDMTEGFDNQKNLLSNLPGLQKEIRQIATEAVNKALIKNGLDNDEKLKKFALKAIAQGNKIGDIGLGNIIFELKLYESPTRVKYAELNDIQNFGFSFMDVMYLHKTSKWPIPGFKSTGGWYSRVASTRPYVGAGSATLNEWIELLHGERGSRFMIEYLKKSRPDNDELLQYFLQKGDSTYGGGFLNKQMIIGKRVEAATGETRVVALFDIEAIRDNRKIGIRYDNKNGALFYYKTDPGQRAILSVNATKESLKEWVNNYNYKQQTAGHDPVKLELQMYQAYWQSKGKI